MGDSGVGEVAKMCWRSVGESQWWSEKGEVLFSVSYSMMAELVGVFEENNSTQ